MMQRVLVRSTARFLKEAKSWSLQEKKSWSYVIASISSSCGKSRPARWTSTRRSGLI
jgi:hypothetical protein